MVCTANTTGARLLRLSPTQSVMFWGMSGKRVEVAGGIFPKGFGAAFEEVFVR